MSSDFRDVQVRAQGPALEIRLAVENKSRRNWTPENFSLGWQFFDPETDFFILEGEWTPVQREVQPGEVASFQISIPFPADPGGYHVYVSPIGQPEGWAYQRGQPFCGFEPKLPAARSGSWSMRSRLREDFACAGYGAP